jgi:hypothetical protein
MKSSLRCSAIVAAIAGLVLAAAAFAKAETCTLELKRLGSENASAQAPNYIYRSSSAQSFYHQIEGKEKSRMELPGVEEQAAAFKRIVKKEPKYESRYPLRGVARLGSHQYAFALDAALPKPKATEAKSQTKTGKTKAGPESGIGKLAELLIEAIAPESPRSPRLPVYSRLYFDFNRNGDLTDDKVVQAETSPNESGYGYGLFCFPRVDIAIDAGGTKLAYSFLLSGYLNTYGDVGYATVSLNAAVYREGNLTLNGKKRHVVLIDSNSNGRFDDETTFPAGPQASGGQVAFEPGDMLLVDPDARNPNQDSPYEATAGDSPLVVSKLVRLDGRFYDLTVSPAGDRITLAPSSVRLGNVTNSNDGFQAVIYSDKCLLKISGKKGVPALVPEGQWKLLSYTIDQTGRYKPQPPEKKKGEAKKGASAIQALADALAAMLGGDGPRSGPRYTLVSAQATAAYKPVRVRAGETAPMAFGPPYTPVVTAGFLGSDKKQLRLTLSLVGSAGEECTNLLVDGGRAPKPEFTIADTKGKVVQSGSFEYG